MWARIVRFHIDTLWPNNFTLGSIASEGDIKYRGFMHKDGEGNSTPLQYSCLANPMDGGAW